MSSKLRIVFLPVIICCLAAAAALAQHQRLGIAPEISKNNIEIRIGERPIVRSLRALYESSKRELPPGLEVFISYKLWMLTHAVSVIRYPGINNLRHLSYEVSLASGPDDPRITVVEVAPKSHLVKKIGADVETRFVFEADIGLNGQVSPPDGISELLEQVDILSVGGQAKGKVELATKTNLVGRLSFAVMTPIIQAIGVGDSFSQWVFTRDDKPLIGDHLMTQILLAPKNVSKLNFKARVSATITTFDLLPDTRRGKWIDLSCELHRQAK